MYKIHVNDNKAGGGTFWHFVEVPRARPFTIEGFEDYEFFVHRPYRSAGQFASTGWIASETSTGRKVTSTCQTQKEAKAQAANRLEIVGLKRFTEVVESYLAEMENETEEVRS